MPYNDIKCHQQYFFDKNNILQHLGGQFMHNLALGQTFYIPWFMIIFFKDQMLRVGIKIKLNVSKQES